MCGIVGKYSTTLPVDRILIERMCEQVKHRGPDSRGLYLEGGVGFGVQRLRVIDLETGDQPIFNEDRSVVVVLNGEIYNFADLRRTLERRGHVFRTGGDTEVIVHLYEDEEIDCVRSLHGMFAFALWDSRRRRLLLARDRVGKKPLFYAHRGGTLSFASEIAALLEDGSVDRRVDYEALDDYLLLQYVPAPRTAFESIRKLPPGSTLVFDGREVAVERYWRLDYGKQQAVTKPGDAAEAVREALRSAVRRRLVADVPLGALLSGGVDSSAVVAAMSEVGSGPVKTFSIGFTDDRFDELPYARRVARHFGTDHHEFVVKPSAIDVVPTLVRHYGEPFADSSAIPTFYLAELAREHVTVALNGDGGDESFAGYDRYRRFLEFERLSRIPGVRQLAGVAHQLLRHGSNGRVRRGLQRRLNMLTLTPPSLYALHVSYFNRRQREELYTGDFAAVVADNDPEAAIGRVWESATGTSLVDVLLETDVDTYLPGALLTKMDIATMAHSLEARSPFLDHELMELAATLPPDLKLSGGRHKLVLRAALRDWLPDEILDRPKMGFGVPISEWLRGELRGFLHDVLLDPVSLDRGLFRKTSVERLIEGHQTGEEHGGRLWALLMLELWFRELADRPASTEEKLGEAETSRLRS